MESPGRNQPDGPRAAGAEHDALVGSLVHERYRVLEKVAAGGMGRIYRAEQVALGRTVALKVLHPKFTSAEGDDGFQKRFLLEASILARLQHPNIVTVFDYGCIEELDPPGYFMVMEFLGGETLLDRFNRLGPMEPEEAVRVFTQLARGLRYAHAREVIHRDLKPSNVMLLAQEGDGALVKILDFGLVKVLRDDSEQVTNNGMFLGSPRYMSPEQVGRGQVGYQSDVYSLGVMLYHALCGVVPFEAETAIKTLMAHLHSPVPMMRDRNPHVVVAPELEEFVERCLEKDPAKRLSSMEAFNQGLLEAGAAAGVAVPSGTAFDYDTGSGQRRPILGPMAEVRTGPLSLPVDSERAVIPVTQATLPSVPPPPPATRSRLRAVSVGAAALLLLAVASAVALGNRRAGSSAAQGGTPASPAASFNLLIDSVPQGAQVQEAERVLGITPVLVTIDKQRARAASRHFTLTLPGFAPYTLHQGASDDDIRVVAALSQAPQPASSAPAAQPSARPARVVRPLAPVRSAPAVQRPPDDDIRLHR